MTLSFDPWRLHRQLTTTSLAKAVLLGLVVVGWIWSTLPGSGQTIWPLLLMAAGLVGWVVGNVVSSRTAQLALMSAQMAATGASREEMERTLARALNRFTLYRTVRVMLYHHLAVLRRRERQFGEAAHISATLLGLPDLGLNREMRTKLLLMMADCALHLNDLASAHQALTELHERKLDLAESMRLLEVRLHYEASCGYHEHATKMLKQKVALAELMPAQASAKVHGLLGQACRMQGHQASSQWLQQRAQLLATRTEAEQENERQTPWGMVAGLGLANPA